jgi:hypothetical protein
MSDFKAYQGAKSNIDYHLSTVQENIRKAYDMITWLAYLGHSAIGSSISLFPG